MVFNVLLRDHERRKPNEGQTKPDPHHMFFNKRLRYPTGSGKYNENCGSVDSAVLTLPEKTTAKAAHTYIRKVLL